VGICCGAIDKPAGEGHDGAKKGASGDGMLARAYVYGVLALAISVTLGPSAWAGPLAEAYPGRTKHLSTT
jgi:hypothetical protein